MKIYLASKFALKDKVEYISQNLINEGHDITCRWWDDDIKSMQLKNNDEKDSAWYKHPEVLKICHRDFTGVNSCDACVLISDESKSLSFNGANVELGYAYARNKKIYILGKVDRNALYSIAIFCKDYKELSESLKHDTRTMQYMCTLR